MLFIDNVDQRVPSIPRSNQVLYPEANMKTYSYIVSLTLEFVTCYWWDEYLFFATFLNFLLNFFFADLDSGFGFCMSTREDIVKKNQKQVSF